ncbi:MAG: glycosyltransferase [Gemmatimonadaceae bacterium]|nr:glycosyltransferase [Gemmatimonadaceae bacterium]
MRILLVNEASGVQGYLAAGLRALGHEVVHAMPHGRSRQGRGADVHLGVEGEGIAAAAARLVRPPLRLARLGRFDVVHHVLGITAFTSRVLRNRDLSTIARSGALVSYTGLGCDEIALLRVRDPAQARRSPCAGCEAHDAIGHICRAEILARRPATAQVASHVDVCVTPMFDYDHAGAFFPRATQVRIPLPVDLATIAPAPARHEGTLRIVHAPTRRGFKGSDVILEAMSRVMARRTDATFTVVEGLRHAQYLTVMRDADILVDQVHAYGAGMAALEALAQGKVVVSGNAPEMQAYFAWGAENPIVDASADPAVLATRIAALLDDRSRVAALAAAGRAFIARRHAADVVAAAHVAAWDEARHRRGAA